MSAVPQEVSIPHTEDRLAVIGVATGGFFERIDGQNVTNGSLQRIEIHADRCFMPTDTARYVLAALNHLDERGNYDQLDRIDSIGAPLTTLMVLQSEIGGQLG